MLDYELIDSGDFEKLERYGKYFLRRPEPQAVWPKALELSEWERLTNAWFRKNGSDQASESFERGEWVTGKAMPDRWIVDFNTTAGTLKLRLAMTAFKHIGLFPEQVSNWQFIADKIKNIDKEQPKVLNLFAYTGAASLAAANAGALVTHVDSVKQVVSWAKENAETSGLGNIRWIVEDAMKYVQREVRRGNKYDGIILDPPAYGRGPEGEKWILADQITKMLEACAQLLENGNSFVILNLYSMGFSPIIAANLLKYYFPDFAEKVEFGELMVKDKSGKDLPLSVFARF